MNKMHDYDIFAFIKFLVKVSLLKKQGLHIVRIIKHFISYQINPLAMILFFVINTPMKIFFFPHPHPKKNYLKPYRFRRPKKKVKNKKVYQIKDQFIP